MSDPFFLNINPNSRIFAETKSFLAFCTFSVKVECNAEEEKTAKSFYSVSNTLIEHSGNSNKLSQPNSTSTGVGA